MCVVDRVSEVYKRYNPEFTGKYILPACSLQTEVSHPTILIHSTKNPKSITRLITKTILITKTRTHPQAMEDVESPTIIFKFA